MILKNIKAPTIAKEKYKWSNQIHNKLSYELWVNFIDDNQDYFTWLESTEIGKERLLNIDNIPISFRKGTLEQLQKGQALAEYNEKKGYHEIIIDFHKEFGMVHTTFMKPITKDHLRILLDMANYLEAYLLNNGTEIIDEKALESLK
ncbi:hypothetical protein JMN32_10400 [Fulvivirga sp. 29W222]|uniref:Uncharacterized protein n=1 Tax=Fulvivirga marina TaxID=2494733 RepID=A0A937FVH5_9BACT|nr:hypothetical protein [Fulvivirga marina]MBL6446724.1 hypothetical protein [Fulvivirga marina]